MYITDSLDCSDTHKLKKACAVQVETFCVKKTFAGDELNCFTLQFPSVKMSFKTLLRTNYDSGAVSLANSYGRCLEKLAKFRNHTVFSDTNALHSSSSTIHTSSLRHVHN